jgi:hypothetical protein
MKKEFQFQNWIRIFDENAALPDSILWDENRKLTPREKQIIYDSIRQFQRGESGEGKYIYQEAKRYVKKCGDDSYLTALKLFIHEEHRHANYLARFMEMQEIPKIKDHWVDGIFRWLRHHGNLEVVITVLVTAEIVAAVYYKALARATSSQCLKDICERILHDEDLHIYFQSYALNRIQYKRNPILNAYMYLNHYILLVGTIPVVWHFHKKVFVAGGYNLLLFAGEIFSVFAKMRSVVRASRRELLRMEQVW